MHESHLTETAMVVLGFIRDHPGNDSSDIAKRLEIDEAMVRDAVRQLLNHKLVERRDNPKLIEELLPEKVRDPRPVYYPS